MTRNSTAVRGTDRHCYLWHNTALVYKSLREFLWVTNINNSTTTQYISVYVLEYQILCMKRADHADHENSKKLIDHPDLSLLLLFLLLSLPFPKPLLTPMFFSTSPGPFAFMPAQQQYHYLPLFSSPSGYWFVSSLLLLSICQACGYKHVKYWVPGSITYS